jgi:DNA mismatch repair ATPase MutS
MSERGEAKEAMDKESRHLLARIRSCLQTILDLEERLEQIELGDELLDEFVHLKSFLQKVESLELREDDVIRIEDATANFLEELRAPLSYLDEDEEGGRQRFLQ